MYRRLIIASAVALAALSAPAFAQDASASAASGAMDMSSMPSTAQDIAPAAVTDPQEFATKATVGNLFEVQSSQIALQASQNDQIKQFAQQMITDHTKAGDEMRTAAASQGNISLPTALDQPHADMLARLQGLTGADFDKAYVQAQTQAHIEAVGLFAGFSQNGAAGPLKDFATKTLPTLQMHYDMVTKLPH